MPPPYSFDSLPTIRLPTRTFDSTSRLSLIITPPPQRSAKLPAIVLFTRRTDVLLWARGLAYGLGLAVQITEPDVYPLAVQGPLAEVLMADVFGRPHGVGARSAVGMGALPFNIPVEIEAIFQIKS